MSGYFSRLREKAERAFWNEVRRSEAEGDLYDPQKAMADLNDGSTDYEAAMEMLNQIEVEAERDGRIQL